MVGIKVTEDGIEKNYVFSYMKMDSNLYPLKSLLIEFFIFEGEERTRFTRQVILSGERFNDFYTRWDNHREVYVELCRDLGIDESIVPSDMEYELNGAQ